MNFNEYQKKSRKTAKYPSIGDPIVYPALGLVNEAGEVAGKVKKYFATKAEKSTPRQKPLSRPNSAMCFGIWLNWQPNWT
jgi:hypothetical protein